MLIALRVADGKLQGSLPDPGSGTGSGACPASCCAVCVWLSQDPLPLLSAALQIVKNLGAAKLPCSWEQTCTVTCKVQHIPETVPHVGGRLVHTPAAPAISYLNADMSYTWCVKTAILKSYVMEE